MPKDLLDKVNALPVENQTPLLLKFKQAFDAAKKGNIDKGVDVLQEQLLTDFIPKGKPHATGGLIDGYATGGVSNLFRKKFANGTDFWDQPEMPDPRYRQVYKSLEDIPQDALLMMMKDPNFDLNTFLNTVRMERARRNSI